MGIQSVYTRDILELSFDSEIEYGNPYIEGGLSVVFSSPNGRKIKVKGFWDGDNSWKVRFAPPVPGIWRWESEATDTHDRGLDGKTGEFETIRYDGSNNILKHGFLKVNDTGRGFEHEDGRPFFWLGDTVWGVTAKGTEEDWQEFVGYRSAQGFNIACINALPQHDGSRGKAPLEPFVSEGRMIHWDKPNPQYFRYLDRLMAVTQQAGMFTALVALWFDYVPGANVGWDVARKDGLTPELAAVYGSYLAARYAAYGTVWFISGDSDFHTEEAISIYSGAANAIKQDTPYEPLITAHMQMGMIAPEALNAKDWFNFHMYQSSHRMNSAETSIESAEKARALSPTRPVLNGEPCYENICCYKELDKKITREFTREVLWKSILAGGNAGITYGAHGIWSWHCEGDPFPGVQDWGMPVSWREALRFEGSDDAARMKAFFEELAWWELEPASDELKLLDYPDSVAAATRDKGIIVAYVPEDRQLKLCVSNNDEYSCSWYNPVSGEWKSAKYETNGNRISLGNPPWNCDGVMLLIRG